MIVSFILDIYIKSDAVIYSVKMADSSCKVGVVFDMQFAALMHQKDLGRISVSDPDPVGFAFKLGLDPGDPDPYSESGSGSWIQMSKNRLKKPKFTVT